MKQIAILGFGIVGGGIPTVLEQNAEQIRQTVGDSVRVRYVLDLRAFPESPYADRIVHTIDPILADPEVSAGVRVFACLPRSGKVRRDVQ